MDNNNREIVLRANTINEKSAREAQQAFAELLCDVHNVYDLLQLQITEVRSIENLFNQLNWRRERFLHGLIYVLVANETDHNYAEKSTQFSCHPVFRVRQCYVKGTVIDNSCTMFVDEVGRVYRNWADYKKNNTLPKGIMVAPRDGIYSFQEFHVLLETYYTPSASDTNAALDMLDSLATFGGFLAVTAPIAAFCGIRMPSQMIAGAATMGLFATCYSMLRSGAQLIDRYQHEQSNDLIYYEPRNSWFAIGNGLIGIGGARATSKLVRAAASGKHIGKLTKFTVNCLNLSAITLSGCVLACSSVNLYLKKEFEEKITKLEYLQLAGSLVQFTQTVRNFSMATTMISKTQNDAIHHVRKNLSSRQRRYFDQLLEQSQQLHGEMAGKMEILRRVDELSTKQHYSDLFKNKNKEAAKRNLPASSIRSGKEVIPKDDGKSQEIRVTESTPKIIQAEATGLVSGNSTSTVNSKADISDSVVMPQNGMDFNEQKVPTSAQNKAAADIPNPINQRTPETIQAETTGLVGDNRTTPVYSKADISESGVMPQNSMDFNEQKVPTSAQNKAAADIPNPINQRTPETIQAETTGLVGDNRTTPVYSKADISESGVMPQNSMDFNEQKVPTSAQNKATADIPNPINQRTPETIQAETTGLVGDNRTTPVYSKVDISESGVIPKKEMIFKAQKLPASAQNKVVPDVQANQTILTDEHLDYLKAKANKIVPILNKASSKIGGTLRSFKENALLVVHKVKNNTSKINTNVDSANLKANADATMHMLNNASSEAGEILRSLITNTLLIVPKIVNFTVRSVIYILIELVHVLKRSLAYGFSS